MRVARIEERGAQLRLRHLVGRRQVLDLLARRNLVGEERLAAVEVARGLVGDGARLRDGGGDLVVRERRQELARLDRCSLFDRDRADDAAGLEREAHFVGRGEHADRAQRSGGGCLLDGGDAHRGRGLGRFRLRVVAAAREGERGGDRRERGSLVSHGSVPPIAYSTWASAPSVSNRVTFSLRRACVSARWESR